ncbi:MAG: RluA family pseudouridine synthase [Clostridiales bacterium]|nr:RluA family pseudouridine synthase [Clostridiales bacterium]
MTTVYCTDGGARLDVFLADETELTRSHIKRLIDTGKVFVGGEAATKAGRTVKTGDEVAFDDVSETGDVLAEDIPLDVVYEDDDISVINKQRNLVVHPGAGNPSGTLVNALKYRYGDRLSSAYGAVRAGIVHRLDKDTTGLIVVARNDFAHAALSKQFAERSVKKLYRAILDGNLKNDCGTVENNIGRDRRNRLKMAVVEDGRHAVTRYNVLERYKNNCYVEFELLTGRTHQIRVHCAHLGHPVSCDALYGGSGRLRAEGQLLHSRSITFTHPKDGREMSFTADEPSDFAAALKALRGKGQTSLQCREDVAKESV